jgi:phosphatidylcholine synthase
MRTMKTKGDPRSEKRPPSRMRRFLAWCVHAYTASGLLCAAGITALLVQPGPEEFRWSFVLMVVATLIDATDGTLARAVRIKETLPGFDGRRLDDIVDFLNYTCLPLMLIWQARLLPPGWEFILVLPLLASAYGFCQVSAKTDDGYFLGFPSYWNLVAFYLYALSLPAWFVVVLLVILSVLTFVPMRYLYPTQRGRLNMVTLALGAAWVVLVAWVLYEMSPQGVGEALRTAVLLSLFFPVYYMAASWLVTLRLWRKKRRRQPGPLGGLPS